MAEKSTSTKSPLAEKLKSVLNKLGESGIEFDDVCCDGIVGDRAKVICLSPDLKGSFKEMGETIRGETVMVRIDEVTRNVLDAWISTGYFKSRSEAAALFIREGLKIRSSELEKLKDAIQQVEKAKGKLRDKAKEVFGDKTDS
jgi:Arc/MetJ-type ribon-helix-helix transcriptional regulator